MATAARLWQFTLSIPRLEVDGIPQRILEQMRQQALEEYDSFGEGGNFKRFVFSAMDATEVSDFMIRLALCPCTIGLSFSVVKGGAA